ncbi:MAG: response regulator transcription factor [Rhodocyclaceae bacterium]|nr:response regulator transcription factor [Rhodocyclaceae bacterium]MBX3667305.1 response regulator transcription factor [Rhodocyclaceae bacterium]
MTMKSNKVRVVLADDHAMLREALRVILERDGDIEVVGEAGDGASTVSQVESLKPDVLVLDIAMPGGNGLEVAQRLKRGKGGTHVIALSAHVDHWHVSQMFKLGARGYVNKTAASSELLTAIRAVINHRHFVSADAAEHLVRDLGGEPETRTRLGLREREVLRRLADGLRSPEIASAMHITVSTVEAHRRNIMRKLDLHTVADLTKYALREGLAEL